jgi:hypothetical protein
MAKKTKKIKVRLAALPAKKKATKAQKEVREITAIGQALRTLGGIGGSAVGTYFGAPPAMGGAVGTGLGALISKWLGQGDYRVVSNSLVKQTGSGAIPAMHSTGQTVTIRHKEFVATINGSVNFTVQRFFLLQPGDTNTFPWLSGVANKFQQYRLKGMIFHYVPTSGYAVSGSNPAIGTVMLQTSYRANDSAPSTKVEMLNEYWASEAAPSEAFCHPIECAPKENPFVTHYVRNNPVPANDSPMLYDLGVTYVATQGMPADGNPVGDLWVTYEVELVKPQIASSVLSAVTSGYLTSTGVTTSSLYGAALTATVNPLPFSVQTNTIYFPVGVVGRYLVTMLFNGGFTAWTGPSGSFTYSNCSAYLYDGIHTRAITAVSGSTTQMAVIWAVELTDPSSLASVDMGTWSWTASSVTLYTTVTPIN